MEKAVYFKLFACCPVVKGEIKSLIYDIQRNHFYDIRNELTEILELSKLYPVIEVASILSEDIEVLFQFFAGFVTEELGFYTTEPEAFPDIDLQWHSPLLISNSIVEIPDLKDPYDLENVLDQLGEIGCAAIQILSSDYVPPETIERYLYQIDGSRIKYIELLLGPGSDYAIDSLIAMMRLQPRVGKIILHSCDRDDIYMEDKATGKAIIGFVGQISTLQHEKIKVDRFRTNIESYTESFQHNLGLNRKVCVNRFGEIKNYLSHERTFGNVRENRIIDIINTDAFKQKWYISNDQIKGCKNCEYRYTCVSNADIVLTDGEYVKDACCYDPLLGDWIK